jgi:hypothetical protein
MQIDWWYLVDGQSQAVADTASVVGALGPVQLPHFDFDFDCMSDVTCRETQAPSSSRSEAARGGLAVVGQARAGCPPVTRS